VYICSHSELREYRENIPTAAVYHRRLSGQLLEIRFLFLNNLGENVPLQFVEEIGYLTVLVQLIETTVTIVNISGVLNDAQVLQVINVIVDCATCDTREPSDVTDSEFATSFGHKRAENFCFAGLAKQRGKWGTISVGSLWDVVSVGHCSLN